MGIAAGSRIGPYEVVALIGEGGMGQVYRAKDTTLNRDVALKVLPPSFVHDVERAARFRREAHVLASLNHTHIGGIHGLEEADGTTALVLEYVGGSTLADRIARGPLPLHDVLPIASQMADALDAAHEQGVVHRDLKPANIKVRPDGTVKVLDFGLAKAVDQSGTAAGLSDGQAVTSPAMTEAGMILGTASYMSPEQARGQMVDRRTDIWAFGCVVFEMLTGTLAFPGDSATDVIANVVRGTPNWSALPSAAAPIVGILRRCLEKDPKRRFHDIGDVRLLLEDAALATPSVKTSVPSSGPARWTAVGLLIGVILGGTVVNYLAPPRSAGTPPSLAQFALAPANDLPLAADTAGSNVAIAPDSSRLVYTTRRGGITQLATRVLNQLEVKPIAGSEGGLNPFFSPDGRSIGFNTFLELRRVPIAGGPAVTICPIDAYFSGASWGANGTIVFTEQSLGLLEVPVSGGKPVTIATPDEASGEQSFSSPVLLPDGQSVLYTVRLKDGTRRIVARRLRQAQSATVVEDGFGAQYLGLGALVFGRGNGLMAAKFDPATLKLAGEPIPVQIGNVLIKAAESVTNVAVSADGTMAYVDGRAGRPESRRLAWVDRSGKHGAAVSPPLEEPRNLRLSPDGRRVVGTVGPGGQGQLVVFDLSGNAQPLKLTFRDHNLFPIWFPDGRRIAFLTRTPSGSRICSIPADGSAVEPDTLLENVVALPTGWSPDGTSMVMERGQPSKILLLNRGTRDPRLWLDTPFEETAGRLSPDGAWLAYASNQSGSWEVWVRPFPGPGAPVRVSAEGGGKPLWSREGRELFYENGGKIMAVRLRFDGSGVATEQPHMLFEGGFVRDDVDPHARYVDVGPDNRFLIVEAGEPESVASLVLVQYWDEELKRLLVTK